jgi:hypothetical protein
MNVETCMQHSMSAIIKNNLLRILDLMVAQATHLNSTRYYFRNRILVSILDSCIYTMKNAHHST